MTDARVTALDHFLFRELHRPRWTPLLAGLFSGVVLGGALRLMNLGWPVALGAAAVTAALLSLGLFAMGPIFRRWFPPMLYDLDLVSYAAYRRSSRLRSSRVEVPTDPRVRELAVRITRTNLRNSRRLRPFGIAIAALQLALVTAQLVLAAVTGTQLGLAVLPQAAAGLLTLAGFLVGPVHARRALAVLDATPSGDPSPQANPSAGRGGRDDPGS